ncbi:SRPBCC family protein [Streptomyces roseus]|uniref:SRPBCC family protein n=1 Tax=Streptomyces roseus TaxID=66430 RepID=UPI003816648D
MERTFLIEVPLDATMAYLQDFGHTEEWDPGTVRCLRIDEGPVRPGSSWQNTSRFRGRTTDLVYRLDSRGPRELVFVGVNKAVTARDQMRFEAESATTTRLTYVASLRFNGLARLAEPFLRREFEALADKVAGRLPSAVRAHHSEA